MDAANTHPADLLEALTDRLGERPASIHAERRLSWTEVDDRAARLASALAEHGLSAQSKVGNYLYNGPEYLEAQYATFKARCVPVNINYRYRDRELAYLVENSDSEALFFHSSLAERVARVAPSLDMKLLVQVADDDTELINGAIAYEGLIATHPPAARIERSPDDLLLLYTGGTTGMPKGVMFRLGSLTASLASAGLALVGHEPMSTSVEVADIVADLDDAQRLTTIPAAPLMHGTGLTLGALAPQFAGATVVTLPSRSFDPHELLAAVERHAVTNLAIVGDVFSKPIIDAIDERRATANAYDTSTLRYIFSSGAMWSAATKQALIDRMPGVQLHDIMNSSEGAMATQVSTAESPPTTARFTLNPTTKVFDDNDREVEPGSGMPGRLAAGGNLPIGYYKDDTKTAGTFRTIDGQTYSFPGDMATIEADGTIVLLGRGSHVVNTGGEKVFPEEVEESVKRVPGVRDCLVVGLDDERFGQAVTAVVSAEPGADLDAAAIIAGVKSDLAGYKAPRHVVFTDTVPRAPNGKADHRAAHAIAERRLSESGDSTTA